MGNASARAATSSTAIRNRSSPLGLNIGVVLDFLEELGLCLYKKAGSIHEPVISRALAKQAVELAQSQGRFTVFALVDALTRLSRQIVNAGDRTEVDQQAGNLLTLAV